MLSFTCEQPSERRKTMASRKGFLYIPNPPRVGFLWLAEMKKLSGARLTRRQMSHLPKVVKRLQLPCQIAHEADSTSLHIYTWTVEKSPSHARPTLFLTIRDHQVPNGHMPHPRHGTVANAHFMSIAINQPNKALCKTAGISSGSLHPSSTRPKKSRRTTQ